MDKLVMAHKIAEAACCMDWLKQTPHISDLCRAEATQYVNDLHNIAMQLAESSVDQVYGKNDTADDICKIQAAGQCVCAEGEE